MKWWLLCIVLATLGMGILFVVVRQPALAETTSGGGVFTVNTSHDFILPGDSELSLREAISISNGILTGPFSFAERTQMAGCVFDAFGNITNGCGGSNNLIQFTPTLTQVVLTDRPPGLTGAGMTINGQVNSGPIILNGTGGADNGFIIMADNVTISHIAFINLGGPSAYIQNYVYNFHKGTQIAYNYLGITPDMTSCSDPRLLSKPNFDIIFWGGTGSAGPGNGTVYIYGNTIGCSVYDGVELGNTGYAYVGEDKTGNPVRNWIGVSSTGHPLPNNQNGINSNLLGYNSVISNTIAYNGSNGILLEQDSNDLINGNNIHHNAIAGINVYSSTLTTMSNNQVHDNNSSGIWISKAASYHNSINGGAYYHNGAAGITEGEGAYMNNWYAISTYDNYGLGIDIYDNGLPDPPLLSIDSVVKASSGVTVTGQYSGTIFLLYQYRIDLYRAAADPSGYGEGRIYIGSATVQWGFPLVTTWQIIDPAGPGCYTAVLTEIDGLNPIDASSSEFTKDTQCVYLSLLHR